MSLGHIHFDPLIAPWVLVGLGVMATALLMLSILGRQRGWIWRVLAVGMFVLALLNPSWVEEKRKAVADVVAIVVDESPSQDFGQRGERTQAMLEHLQSTLGERNDLDLRVVRNNDFSALDRETLLFDGLDQALSDVPESRRAGVVFITDGQIHDVPDNANYGPLHAILSGDKNETDRRIVVHQASAYGIVGQDVSIEFSVEQEGRGTTNQRAQVTLKGAEGGDQFYDLAAGERQKVTLKIVHAGANIFELTTPSVPNEITPANNKAAVVVNGVRDRLKVLLVSGQPHAGGRTWRDLLKSDPGVDLVHFTILREPRKLDATPQNELSLIAFPFRELFEIKLYDFDLIVFDRYKLNHILPDYYFDNIARYVREGGALLVSSGPDFIGETSLANTALADIFPALPQSHVFREQFKPAISKDGTRHPITQSLGDDKVWGDWLRQIQITPRRGDVLMTGVQDNPLLVVNREAEGRVAQLASDHIFLWSRGYDGGGPSADLLRRTVHWLMKEPELDEEALQVRTDGSKISVMRPGFSQASPTIQMTRPDGTINTFDMVQDESGVWRYDVKADQLGVYHFEEVDGRQHFTIIGDIDPPELQSVLTSQEPLEGLVKNSRGGFLWAADTATPDIRLMRDGARSYAGNGWIGLRRNDAYVVNGVKAVSLFPFWILALLISGLSVWAWWREGRS